MTFPTVRQLPTSRRPSDWAVPQRPTYRPNGDEDLFLYEVGDDGSTRMLGMMTVEQFSSRDLSYHRQKLRKQWCDDDTPERIPLRRHLRSVKAFFYTKLDQIHRLLRSNKSRIAAIATIIGAVIAWSANVSPWTAVAAALMALLALGVSWALRQRSHFEKKQIC